MSSRLCPHCMQMADSDICPHCGKDVNYAGSPAHLPAGYVVRGKHPYVLGAALGQGGFGITYIALDMVTNERVAIKEYYPTYCSTRTDGVTVTAYTNQEEVYAKGRDRFLDEARTLKSLSDLPNIVDVLDFFELNNTAYLVMEFVDGSSLKEYAAKNGAFPAQAFLKQLRPLMEDMQKMHARGVIHRDIAPDNIILQPDGQMKLIDFGAARSYIGDKSMTVVVKKGFAPVEQYFSTGSTPATDVYALAATIYYCITGKVPMDSAQRQAEETLLASPLSLGADITQAQEQALLQALAITQKTRTQSILTLVEALFCQPQNPSEESRPEPDNIPSDTKDPVSDSTKKKKRLFPVAAAIAILLLAACFFYITDMEKQKKYELACQQFSQQQFEDALVLFSELGDYEDSRKMLEEAYRQHGLNCLKRNQYLQAYDCFQHLPENVITERYLQMTRRDWGKYIIQNALVEEVPLYRETALLTDADCDYLYNFLTAAPYYTPSATPATQVADFDTRLAILCSLPAKYANNHTLIRLFETFRPAAADSFIAKEYGLFCALWDLPVVQNILTEGDNLPVWLAGKWQSDGNAYITFYDKDKNGNFRYETNLPRTGKPADAVGYQFIGPRLVWVSSKGNELANIYRVNLQTPDTISVYCYKNNQTYFMSRDK